MLDILTQSFLGFKIKAYKKRNKYIVYTKMTDKAKEQVSHNIKEQLIAIQHFPTTKNINMLNRIIAGSHNYYKIVANVYQDFKNIKYNLSFSLYNRLKNLRTSTGNLTHEYESKYSKYNLKKQYILNEIMYPLTGIKTTPPFLFNQTVSNYTKEGRKIIHTRLGYIDENILNYIAHNPILNKSVEYNDNRLSKYSAQKGACIISGYPLLENMEAHHIIPVNKGGDDKFRNLILVIPEIHKLIHATNIEHIQYYIKELNLDNQEIKKLNKYRKKIGNEII